MTPYPQQPAAPAIEFLPDLPAALDALDAQFADPVRHVASPPQPVDNAPIEAYAAAAASKAGIFVGLAVLLSALIVGGIRIAEMRPPAAAVAHSQHRQPVAFPLASAAPAKNGDVDRVAPLRRRDAAPASQEAGSLGNPRFEPDADGGAANAVRIVASAAVANPVLVRARTAWNTGDLAAAEVAYASALATEPQNIDALGGLAAIALRQGRYEHAENLYLRALEADPTNAVAVAGVLGLQHAKAAFGVESRLKNLIAAQPDHPALRFALGNLYAGDHRWNEAQREYLHAHTGDPRQPDYLFNLAVSLDHLRLPAQAAEYYGLALAAAALHPAEFDRDKASARWRELTP